MRWRRRRRRRRRRRPLGGRGGRLKQNAMNRGLGQGRGRFIQSKRDDEEEELFVFNFTTAGGSIQPCFTKRVVRSAVAV
jgi:hypothetical protein